MILIASIMLSCFDAHDAINRVNQASGMTLLQRDEVAEEIRAWTKPGCFKQQENHNESTR